MFDISTDLFVTILAVAALALAYLSLYDARRSARALDDAKKKRD